MPRGKRSAGNASYRGFGDIFFGRNDGRFESYVASVVVSIETRRVTPLDTFSLLTRTDALDTKDAVGRSRSRIEKVSASLGTSVTRLEIASRALSKDRIAEEAAIGRILDADIGFEASELARRTILQKVAQTILAQANVSSYIALKLLAP